MQLPKSKFLLAALILSASFDSSTAQSPEDFRIVEVYNQYFFAIRSAEVCDNQPFKSVDEEQKFKNNFVKVRVEAANALRRNKPNFTKRQIDANMKFMDDNTTAAIEKNTPR